MQVTDSRLAGRLPVRSDSASGRRSPAPSMVIGGLSHSSTPFGGHERAEMSPQSDAGCLATGDQSYVDRLMI